MAIFGTLEIVKSQADKQKFAVAFEYLEKVLDVNSVEHKRLNNYSLNAFEKIQLDDKNFALEQVYDSKERDNCFFESHRQYIDVQFILEGEEIIEVSNSDILVVSFPYNEQMDLIKYEEITKASQIVLKKGDVAIFYPQDAHMPCVKVVDSVKVLKTVVKVAV
ncbi:YhcH/YjgK/YiaL family protein [bacterium]|nr:YhcH/YjgK/YiaL family protein [bacterium]MBU1993807.1 YhcH/YjgK/YiaL family protein [bacterium]